MLEVLKGLSVFNEKKPVAKKKYLILIYGVTPETPQLKVH